VIRTAVRIALLGALLCPRLAAQVPSPTACDSIASTLEAGRWPTPQGWGLVEYCGELQRTGYAVAAAIRRLPTAWRVDSAQFDAAHAGQVRHRAVFNAALRAARDSLSPPGAKVAAILILSRQEGPLIGDLGLSGRPCRDLGFRGTLSVGEPWIPLDSTQYEAVRDLLAQLVREARDERLISVIYCAATQFGAPLPNALDPDAVKVTISCGMRVQVTNEGGKEGAVVVEPPSLGAVRLYLGGHGTGTVELGEPGLARALVRGEVVWSGVVPDSACPQ
jgi:hypothetical protein